VLQEQEFERVGSDRTLQVDVRIIAATNRDLAAEVRERRFRADLFYRLNVLPISVPSLRERTGDIPLLVEHFLAHHRRALGKAIRGVSPASLDRLCGYHWPGNVRELQNVIERACVLATGPVLEVGSLTGSGELSQAPEILTLENMERVHIRRALEACGGRIQGTAGAAALLGIHPNTLRSRMDRLGLRRGG
jgi:transcriptional regulator with GAF, ATPase, and Fis domain